MGGKKNIMDVIDKPIQKPEFIVSNKGEKITSVYLDKRHLYLQEKLEDFIAQLDKFKANKLAEMQNGQEDKQDNFIKNIQKIKTTVKDQVSRIYDPEIANQLGDLFRIKVAQTPELFAVRLEGASEYVEYNGIDITKKIVQAFENAKDLIEKLSSASMFGKFDGKELKSKAEQDNCFIAERTLEAILIHDHYSHNSPDYCTQIVALAKIANSAENSCELTIREMPDKKTVAYIINDSYVIEAHTLVNGKSQDMTEEAQKILDAEKENEKNRSEVNKWMHKMKNQATEQTR